MKNNGTLLRNCIAHIIEECDEHTGTCVDCPFFIPLDDTGDGECFFEMLPGPPNDWAITNPPQLDIVTSTEVDSIKCML